MILQGKKFKEKTTMRMKNIEDITGFNHKCKSSYDTITNEDYDEYLEFQSQSVTQKYGSQKTVGVNGGASFERTSFSQNIIRNQIPGKQVLEKLEEKETVAATGGVPLCETRGNMIPHNLPSQVTMGSSRSLPFMARTDYSEEVHVKVRNRNEVEISSVYALDQAPANRKPPDNTLHRSELQQTTLKEGPQQPMSGEQNESTNTPQLPNIPQYQQNLNQNNHKNMNCCSNCHRRGVQMFNPYVSLNNFQSSKKAKMVPGFCGNDQELFSDQLMNSAYQRHFNNYMFHGKSNVQTMNGNRMPCCDHMPVPDNLNFHQFQHENAMAFRQFQQPPLGDQSHFVVPRNDMNVTMGNNVIDNTNNIFNDNNENKYDDNVALVPVKNTKGNSTDGNKENKTTQRNAYTDTDSNDSMASNVPKIERSKKADSSLPQTQLNININLTSPCCSQKGHAFCISKLIEEGKFVNSKKKSNNKKQDTTKEIVCNRTKTEDCKVNRKQKQLVATPYCTKSSDSSDSCTKTYSKTSSSLPNHSLNSLSVEQYKMEQDFVSIDDSDTISDNSYLSKLVCTCKNGKKVNSANNSKPVTETLLQKVPVKKIHDLVESIQHNDSNTLQNDANVLQNDSNTLLNNINILHDSNSSLNNSNTLLDSSNISQSNINNTEIHLDNTSQDVLTLDNKNSSESSRSNYTFNSDHNGEINIKDTIQSTIVSNKDSGYAEQLYVNNKHICEKKSQPVCTTPIQEPLVLESANSKIKIPKSQSKNIINQQQNEEIVCCCTKIETKVPKLNEVQKTRSEKVCSCISNQAFQAKEEMAGQEGQRVNINNLSNNKNTNEIIAAPEINQTSPPPSEPVEKPIGNTICTSCMEVLFSAELKQNEAQKNIIPNVKSRPSSARSVGFRGPKTSFKVNDSSEPSMETTMPKAKSQPFGSQTSGQTKTGKPSHTGTKPSLNKGRRPQSKHSRPTPNFQAQYTGPRQGHMKSEIRTSKGGSLNPDGCIIL